MARIKRMAWGTVARWLESASAYAQRFNRRMLRGFVIHELQADEIRTFAGAKKRVIWVLTILSRGWGAPPNATLQTKIRQSLCSQFEIFFHEQGKDAELIAIIQLLDDLRDVAGMELLNKAGGMTLSATPKQLPDRVGHDHQLLDVHLKLRGKLSTLTETGGDLPIAARGDC